MDNMAGFFITFPVSYAKSLRITIQWPGKGSEPTANEQSAWNQSKQCHNDGSFCKIIAYYAVIANKLVHGAKLKSNFKDAISKESTQAKTKTFKSVDKAISKMTNSPESYAPGLKSECKLTCQKVEPGQERVLFSEKNIALVIQSIRLRMYDIKQEKLVLSTNWRRMLITMIWDGKQPQVREIPLAGLFINGLDFIREVKSLTTGLRNTTCEAKGESASNIALNDRTAYLFYEMPFWKSAQISVKVPNGSESAIICSQISTKKLDFEEYHPRLTGYFNAQLQQQAFTHHDHQTIFHLQNQWGHVVAINFFLKNDKIASTHELDVIIETDEANAPVFSGTGLEDFFHYVHDFQANANKTGPFNGAPFYYRKDRYRILRCFRHMPLDPILFTTGIRIYVESAFDRYRLRNFRTFVKTTSSFSQNILPDSLFTVVLYYGGKGSGGIITDKVKYLENANASLSTQIKFSPPSVKIFRLRSSSFENQPGIFFDRMVVSMKPGQQVTHKFKISSNNAGVILRREYHSLVPNQKANVKVDGEDAGLWFCPQRALTKEVSLRLNDYLLPPEKTAGKESIEVTLIAVTQWETISVQVMSVVLTD